MTSDSPEASPESIPEITVQRLFEDRRETLQLEVLTPDTNLERPVRDPDLSSPGLALAGYTERFSSDRMQVFGETEIAYLEGLSPEERRDRVKGVLGFGIPVVFVTKALSLPDEFVEVAAECSVPILRLGSQHQGILPTGQALSRCDSRPPHQSPWFLGRRIRRGVALRRRERCREERVCVGPG